MRSFALRGLYQLATGTALALAGPFLLARRGGHYLPTLAGRLGRPPAELPPEAGTGALWLHAVSVGEAGVAATLARALPEELPLLVTTVTPTGQARARSLFQGRAAVAYLPFDLGFAVGRFFRRFRPRALVLVEGDYWPLVLAEARRRRLPVAVINGRVGDRSFQRMRRLRPLLGPLFSGVDAFGMQTAADRDRLLALGISAGRITVTGNLKYESPDPAPKPDLEARIREIAAGRPILLAGSTMAGEEEIVLAAHQEIGADRALLVLAPRHPERWNTVDAFLRACGIPVLRRSRSGEPAPGDGLDGPAQATGSVGAREGGAHTKEPSRAEPGHLPERAGGGPPPAVLLLDSLGELAALYRIAAAAFIGGTLVPTGGHNPLEPARYGVPVAVGPSMFNFRDMAEQFDAAGAWRRVTGAADLAAVWRGWLDDPASAREQGARALRLLEANRGALARTLEMLAPLLAPAGLEISPMMVAGGTGGA